MPYPINYDFGNNWNKKIVPHLNNPKIKAAIKEGINDYLDQFPLCKKRYKPNTAPADYSSRDAYMTTLDEKWERMFWALRENNMVPKNILNIEKKIAEYDSDNDDGIDIDDLGYEHMVAEFKFRDEYFTWDHIKDDLETYHLCGGCHWYNPTFGLELAKLVEPKEKWRVRMGTNHTTVINKAGTKVFDLLYWGANDERMNNYLFGDEIKNPDPTMGGKDAYINSEWLDSDDDLSDYD